MPTSARLLRVLALLQARPVWAGAELADRLGVTVRTLRRDMQRLRDLDYPVHSVPGVAGGYRLGAGAVLPPLLLDDDEAIAVVLSLRSTAPHTVAGLAEASTRALAKLDQVMPARLRERSSALQHATVALAGPEPAVDANTLTLLAAACRRRQRLTFGYRDHAGACTTRLVEPHRLVSAGYRWYLLAFDNGAGDWRTFRVDRISGTAPRDRFPPREAPDAAAYVAAQVTTAPYRYRARIVVRASASALAGLIAPTVGVVEDLGGGECLLTTGSDSLDALAFHLAALGAEFAVQEPPELAERMMLLAGRLTRGAAAPAHLARAAAPARRPAQFRRRENGKCDRFLYAHRPRSECWLLPTESDCRLPQVGPNWVRAPVGGPNLGFTGGIPGSEFSPGGLGPAPARAWRTPR